MIAGSMFAGIGGFDLGAERAGMETLWGVEKDPQARKLLRARFPGLEVHADVTTCDPRELGRVDVLTAGWPCQDLSVAGNRAGLAGERSGLWREVVRFLGVLRPTWFVGENVPGLLSSDGGRDMGTVLWQLGELGYGWAYRVLDARYFGVAQRRRRVLIVGCLGDPARAAEVLLEPEGREWHPAPRREAREAVAGTLGGGAGERGWAPDTDRMTFVPEGFGESGQGWWRQGLGPVRAEGENRPSRPSSVVVAHTLRAEGMDASEDGTGRGTPLVVAPPLMAGAGTNHNSPGFGRDQAVVVAALTGRGNRQDDQETGQLVFESRFARNGRGAPTTIVPPLKAQSGQSGKGDGAPLLMAQSAVRRLTPRECEALQGFPDGWTEGFSDSTRYRMLGNAICVNVAEWVLTRIAAEEERR